MKDELDSIAKSDHSVTLNEGKFGNCNYGTTCRIFRDRHDFTGYPVLAALPLSLSAFALKLAL